MKSKLLEWFNRYFFPEVFAVIGAVTGGLFVNTLLHKPIATALGGTWGENIGYYGTIVYKDMKERKKITVIDILKVLRNEVFEFGVAEYFDSFVIRPFAMYYFPKLTGNIALGLLLGKFSADITFYIPTIFFYELRKKVFKD